MAKEKVLLIDDDDILRELLADHVRAAGYQPIAARNGTEGLRKVSHARPDLVVLDVMMPGMDGWEVCQRIRQKSSVPVIMLTAKGEEIDKLRGFQLGVDDYVTKPFSFAELIARMSAVLSRARHGAEPTQTVMSADLMVDLDQRRVTKSGKVVDLTPTEYRLLGILVRHIGRPVPTERLLLDVWGTKYQGETEYVKHYIWALRSKIEVDPGNPKHIMTERGFGYLFQ